MDEDKFKKETNCRYCGKEMEAKYRSKKFCSDKCRVYFGREKKIIEVLESEYQRNKSEIDKNMQSVILTGVSIMHTSKNGTMTNVDPFSEEGERALGEYKKNEKMLGSPKSTTTLPRLEGESSLDYKIRMSELQSQSKTK